MEFDKIITSLDVLEETSPYHKDYEGYQEGKRSHSKNDKGRGNKRSTNRSTFNAKARNDSSHNDNRCDLYKLFKGEDFSMSRTQNTASLRTTSKVK